MSGLSFPAGLGSTLTSQVDNLPTNKMTPARDPKQKNDDKSFKNRVIYAENPGIFWDFLGDHFGRVESSGDQNLTMFILDFHVFPKMIPK